MVSCRLSVKTASPFHFAQGRLFDSDAEVHRDLAQDDAGKYGAPKARSCLGVDDPSGVVVAVEFVLQIGESLCAVGAVEAGLEFPERYRHDVVMV